MVQRPEPAQPTRFPPASVRAELSEQAAGDAERAAGRSSQVSPGDLPTPNATCVKAPPPGRGHSLYETSASQGTSSRLRPLRNVSSISAAAAGTTAPTFRNSV